MERIQFSHSYNDIISTENLLAAWKEFVRCKRCKLDVADFSSRLLLNIHDLHHDLENKTYKHGIYFPFKISDPKPRDIHKALVRDRLLHHAIYRKLYPFFDRTFTADSYSCRNEKGTHRALDRFRNFSRKASLNHTKTTWVLKCDVKKFFASIDHKALLDVVGQYISDKDILWLINEIVGSFHSAKKGIGLPLGNLTSQLLVNIYMNEFDQFVKHRLKAKYYIRYADDFVIMSHDREWLISIMPLIKEFLSEQLKLQLHPNKISIRTVASGVDYLGWVHFPDHRVLRTATKRRMFKAIRNSPAGGPKPEALASYLGMLKHGNAHKLQLEIRSIRNYI
jgi:retron-type reverse transcriptase